MINYCEKGHAPIEFGFGDCPMCSLMRLAERQMVLVERLNAARHVWRGAWRAERDRAQSAEAAFDEQQRAKKEARP